jgi:hypothetical protein
MLEPSGCLRRQRLAELGARFTAGAHFGAGLQAETRIAGAIAEDAGAHTVEMLALVAARGHFGDPAILDVRRKDRGFEQQRDVGLAHHFVVEQQIPEFPAALRIVDGVGEPQLFDQAALAPPRARGVLVGAHDMHLDFTRGIAAQARAILHQDDARSVARRCDCRAHTRQATAGDEDIGLQPDLAHVPFRGPKAGVARRDLVKVRGSRRPGLCVRLAGEHD